MVKPVIATTHPCYRPEAADLLARYRIKRVPVIQDGRVVGIVSRATLEHRS